MSINDQFEHILDMVMGMAEYAEYKAMQEIKAMAETHRRSIGQRARRFLERLEELGDKP